LAELLDRSGLVVEEWGVARLPHRPKRSTIMISLLALAITAIGATPVSAIPPRTKPAVVRASSVPAAPPVTGLVLGVTHTDHSLDPSGDARSVARGEAILATHPGTIQNVSMMGWGQTNPEPSNGVYDFTSLDSRIAEVRRTGGTPVITLCCSPDWMKGGAPGTTDWSNLEKPPTPSHFADFAALARQVALRYPDVRHFIVWNELKGFHDPKTNRWRYEDYTTLYNLVYDAVKAANPAALVGGPYVVMTTWKPGTASNPSRVSGPWGVVDQRAFDVIEYWLSHAHGADFIALDGSSAVRTGEYLTDPHAATEKFAAIDRWVRARTTLPIWWTELYPVSRKGMPGMTLTQQADVWQRALNAIEQSGGNVVLLWQPESRRGQSWQGLWTDTSVADGGRSTTLCTKICSQLLPPVP
jgi:hypothetical protein